MAGVCDVYEPNLQKGLKAASTGAKAYDNYKRVLEDPTIDVVIVATPDHWHAQMVIDAVEAGKDVYVEKPMAHKIEDGFRVIEAVRRTKRVVQVGMQRRSFDLFQEGKQLMDRVGEVRLVNAWWLNNQKSLRQMPLAGKLDWAQWLGPAPHHAMDADALLQLVLLLGLRRWPDGGAGGARDRRHSLVHELDVPGGSHLRGRARESGGRGSSRDHFDGD